MWDRERHARETAAYLHQQQVQRLRQQQEGGLVLDIDLGHCRPRSMLEGSAEAAAAVAVGLPRGHVEGKEAEEVGGGGRHRALPLSSSLHASAADGDLATLRLWAAAGSRKAGPPQQERGEWDDPFPAGEGASWGGGDDGGPGPVGLTPLALAAACSDHATVDLLLAQGCDVRVGAGGAPSPAHVAALRDPSALVSLLDRPGAEEEEAEAAAAADGQSLSLLVLRARDGAYGLGVKRVLLCMMDGTLPLTTLRPTTKQLRAARSCITPPWGATPRVCRCCSSGGWAPRTVITTAPPPSIWRRR